MSFSFTIALPEIIPTSLADVDVEGEDIALRGGVMSETAHGDLATVRGVDAAKQSINRELPASPGSFPRRPLWGGGLAGLQFKNATPATKDRAITRSRARLLVNPRVKRIEEVSGIIADTGIVLTVRVDTISGRLDSEIVVKPPGVS
jgi:phage baseplate assembly protein W